MSFERVAPQVVRHSDGYTVQIGDCYHIEYLEGERAAKVAADLDGPVVRLHTASVEWMLPDERLPSDEERWTILDRVRAGLAAMGDSCELVNP